MNDMDRIIGLQCLTFRAVQSALQILFANLPGETQAKLNEILRPAIDFVNETENYIKERAEAEQQGVKGKLQ